MRVDIYFIVLTYCIAWEVEERCEGVVDSHCTLLPTESRCGAVCVSVWSCSV